MALTFLLAYHNKMAFDCSQLEVVRLSERVRGMPWSRTVYTAQCGMPSEVGTVAGLDSDHDVTVLNVARSNTES